MAELTLKSIGVYSSAQKNPYEAPRQPREDSDLIGEIILNPGHEYEQALENLEGFDRIWVIFQFHHNENWKPKVRPPRGTEKKVGVFATRSPYRPNSLGLSCLRLQKIEKLKLTVIGADLLDGTPIFDIKPYIPGADAFPQSKAGWLEGIEEKRWQIEWSKESSDQLDWLEKMGLSQLRPFLEQQLEFEPFDSDRKRISEGPSENTYILAYRTWRVLWQPTGERTLRITRIFSGYSDLDLASTEDRWNDKDLHRRFVGLKKSPS